MIYQDYITQHAIPLAQAVRHFLAREIPYRQLEDLSWQLLFSWQALPHSADKLAANPREFVFWHLLHSLHQWDEWQLSGDPQLRQQLMECVNFLTGQGPCPPHCIGSRP